MSRRLDDSFGVSGEAWEVGALKPKFGNVKRRQHRRPGNTGVLGNTGRPGNHSTRRAIEW
jgi:hypothetical protein